MRHEHTRPDRPARFTPALHPSRLRGSSAHASSAATHSTPGRRPALPSRSRSPHLSRLVAFPARIHLRIPAGRAALHPAAPSALPHPVRAAVAPTSQPLAQRTPPINFDAEDSHPSTSLPVSGISPAWWRSNQVVGGHSTPLRVFRHHVLQSNPTRRVVAQPGHGPETMVCWQSRLRRALNPTTTPRTMRPHPQLAPAGIAPGLAAFAAAQRSPVACVPASSRHAEVWLAGARKLGNHFTPVSCLTIATIGT